jgi:hypothetical protein
VIAINVSVQNLLHQLQVRQSETLISFSGHGCSAFASFVSGLVVAQVISEQVANLHGRWRRRERFDLSAASSADLSRRRERGRACGAAI